jgi:uncharacterized membrane protein
MEKGRLEAFSDGVIAIIITIMVLEIKMPGAHHDTLQSLIPFYPVFICYVISFIYVGIYWNNHHHLMQAVTSVSGAVLWANLHLLFWLSTVPLVTEWMGENNFTKWPTVMYGVSLIMCAVAYAILVNILKKHEGPGSLFTQAIGNDRKGMLSIVIYAVAILLAWLNPCISFCLYFVVACIWFIPDRRIERRILDNKNRLINVGRHCE